ncbi:MAG: RidA family protein [Pseudomonadota bacterium]
MSESHQADGDNMDSRVIHRVRGGAPTGRSVSSAYKDLVWVVATATNESLDIVDQTKQALANLDNDLREQHSDKSRIVSAQIFLADIEDKPMMDEVWTQWIGPDPDAWPHRACVGVGLGGHWLIEITVVAVRDL